MMLMYKDIAKTDDKTLTRQLETCTRNSQTDMALIYVTEILRRRDERIAELTKSYNELAQRVQELESATKEKSETQKKQPAKKQTSKAAAEKSTDDEK